MKIAPLVKKIPDNFSLILCLALLLGLAPSQSFSRDIMQDVDTDYQNSDGQESDDQNQTTITAGDRYSRQEKDGYLINETVRRISSNNKVFILSNKSKELLEGDFVSLVSDEKLIARAIVGKVKDNLAAIKVIRIHSLDEWGRVSEKQGIGVIRGDDSWFLEDSIAKAPAEKVPNIEKDQDLYNSDLLLSLTATERTAQKRDMIQSNNIFNLGLGFVESVDDRGDDKRYLNWSGSWWRKITEPFWFRATLGYSVLQRFPAEDLTTELMVYNVRVLYGIELPAYFYAFPYLGYQLTEASSENAGTSNANSSNNPGEELSLVEKAEQKKVVAGVTFLKRMVPAWFFEVNIGTDMVGLGLAFEF